MKIDDRYWFWIDCESAVYILFTLFKWLLFVDFIPLFFFFNLRRNNILTFFIFIYIHARIHYNDKKYMKNQKRSLKSIGLGVVTTFL